MELASCYKCGGKWRFCRQQQRASERLQTRLGRRRATRSPSWPVVARSLVRSDGPPYFVRVGGGCNYNLDGQKMAVSNAIFSEKRRRGEEGGKCGCLFRSSAKATIFGQEQAQMRAAVERDGLRRPSLRLGAFLHVQTHISTKSDGLRRSAEGGGRKREREGKLQMNRFSRRPLFLMTIPAADRGRGRGDRRRPRMSCGRGRGGKFGNVPPFSLLHINDRFGLVEQYHLQSTIPLLVVHTCCHPASAPLWHPLTRSTPP